MQIPPTTALLNLMAALPAQGAAAAPVPPKTAPSPVAPPPTSTAEQATGERQPAGLLPRGSHVNIIA